MKRSGGQHGLWLSIFIGLPVAPALPVPVVQRQVSAAGLTAASAGAAELAAMRAGRQELRWSADPPTPASSRLATSGLQEQRKQFLSKRNASRVVLEAGLLPEQDEELPTQEAGMLLRVHGSSPEQPAKGQTLKAWADVVLSARKFGRHRLAATPGTFLDHARAVVQSAACSDWYFFVVTLVVLVIMDAGILQQLPETGHTHVALVGFWLMVAGVYSVEIWLRFGLQDVSSWMAGYVLEVVYAADRVFVTHLILSSLETPQRLVAKALFIVLLASLAFRVALTLGLAGWLDSLYVVPYLLGMSLLYCGTRQIVSDHGQATDVTQTQVVRIARGLLPGRLGEFYDEEREAIVAVSGGKARVTLLGVALSCLLVADFALSEDVVLAKAELLPSAFLNLSSSALAIFMVRALFFVLRDLLFRIRLANSGAGLVLCAAGAQALVGRSIPVHALASCGLAAAVMAAAVSLSAMSAAPAKALP